MAWNYINPFTHRPFQPRFNVPEVFGEALSYEDQILWLAKHFKELKDRVDSIHPEELKDEILADVTKYVEATLDSFMVVVNRRLIAMEKKIDSYVASDLIYDPTQGGYVPSKDAMRRVYAALVQSGESHVHDMSQLTVTELAGKTAHAYSVAALGEVDWSDEIGETDPEADPFPKEDE